MLFHTVHHSTHARQRSTLQTGFQLNRRFLPI